MTHACCLSFLFPSHPLSIILLSIYSFFWWPSNTINCYFIHISIQHSHSSIFCTYEPSTNTFAQLRVRNSQLDGKRELTSRRWWFPRSPTAPLQNTAGLSIPWPKEASSACGWICCFHGRSTWEWQPLHPCGPRNGWDQLPGVQTNPTWAPGWPPLVKFTGPADVFSSQLLELEKDSYECPHFIEMKNIPERSRGTHQ